MTSAPGRHAQANTTSFPHGSSGSNSLSSPAGPSRGGGCPFRFGPASCDHAHLGTFGSQIGGRDDSFVVSELDPAEDDLDEHGARRMTPRVLHQLCRSRGHFLTPAVNTTLYLQDLRFRRIENLQEFGSCRVLHLSHNCLTRIEGLDAMRELQALYLQSNDLRCLDGLAPLACLHTLHLSHNPLGSLEGLPPSMPALRTLAAANTGLSSPAGLSGLSSRCPSLEVLDLSDNPGLGGRGVLDTLCGLGGLRVLYVTNTGLHQIPNLRRILVSALPRLSYLDNGPVDDCDRRGCEAWLLGGVAAEKAARLAYRAERRLAQKRSTLTFAVERARRRALRELGRAGNDAAALELILEDTDDIVRRRLVPAAAAIIGAAELLTPQEAAAAAAAAIAGGGGGRLGGATLTAAEVNLLPLARYTASVVKAALRHEAQTETEEGQGAAEAEEKAVLVAGAVEAELEETPQEVTARSGPATAEAGGLAELQASAAGLASAPASVSVEAAGCCRIGCRCGEVAKSNTLGATVVSEPCAPAADWKSSPSAAPPARSLQLGEEALAAGAEADGQSCGSCGLLRCTSGDCEGMSAAAAEGTAAGAVGGEGHACGGVPATTAARDEDPEVKVQGAPEASHEEPATASAPPPSPAPAPPPERPTVQWRVTGVSECVVCSEAFAEDQPVALLPCNHFFHDRCIRRWLLGFSTSCPMCRAPVRVGRRGHSERDSGTGMGMGGGSSPHSSLLGSSRSGQAGPTPQLPAAVAATATAGVTCGEPAPWRAGSDAAASPVQPPLPPVASEPRPELSVASAAPEGMVQPEGAVAAGDVGPTSTLTAIDSPIGDGAKEPNWVTALGSGSAAMEGALAASSAGGEQRQQGAATDESGRDGQNGGDEEGGDAHERSRHGRSGCEGGGEGRGGGSGKQDSLTHGPQGGASPRSQPGDVAASAVACGGGTVSGGGSGGRSRTGHLGEQPSGRSWSSTPSAIAACAVTFTTKAAAAWEARGTGFDDAAEGRYGPGSSSAGDSGDGGGSSGWGFMSRYSYRAPLPVPRGNVDEYEEGCWELPGETRVSEVPYL